MVLVLVGNERGTETPASLRTLREHAWAAWPLRKSRETPTPGLSDGIIQVRYSYEYALQDVAVQVLIRFQDEALVVRSRVRGTIGAQSPGRVRCFVFCSLLSTRPGLCYHGMMFNPGIEQGPLHVELRTRVIELP